jgi:hypothetical protein
MALTALVRYIIVLFNKPGSFYNEWYLLRNGEMLTLKEVATVIHVFRESSRFQPDAISVNGKIKLTP